MRARPANGKFLSESFIPRTWRHVHTYLPCSTPSNDMLYPALPVPIPCTTITSSPSVRKQQPYSKIRLALCTSTYPWFSGSKVRRHSSLSVRFSVCVSTRSARSEVINKVRVAMYTYIACVVMSFVGSIDRVPAVKWVRAWALKVRIMR